MSFHSDAHLLLGGEPTPPEVGAWQHPSYRDSFTVTLDTADRRGHIAISGSPGQLVELLERMTQALTDVATAAGQLPASQAPTRPAEPATHRELTAGRLGPEPGRQQERGPGSRRHSEHPARIPGKRGP
jgi:hypothetical protein